jgi:hypothetical protein
MRKTKHVQKRRHLAIADSAAAGSANIVVSLQREGTARLLRDLRSQHSLPAVPHPWGSERAYLSLFDVRHPLIALDVPRPMPENDLVQRIRALSSFSSVVALVPEGTDSVPLLRAGADNVLPRDMPARELATRLAADRRWITASASTRPQTPSWMPVTATTRQSSQRALLNVLGRARRPLCCHDLCLLFGTAEEPMSRRALQARVLRLSEHLTRHELALSTTSQWGRVIYSGVRAAG